MCASADTLINDGSDNAIIQHTFDRDAEARAPGARKPGAAGDLESPFAPDDMSMLYSIGVRAGRPPSRWRMISRLRDTRAPPGPHSPSPRR